MLSRLPAVDGLRTLERELDRWFGPLRETGATPWNWNVFAPAADIRSTDDGYRIELDVPGLSENDIDLRVDGRMLTVRGERRVPETGKPTRCERAFGRFERVFHLSDDADTERIEAQHQHGVLTIVVPKQERARARRIEVKAS